MASWSDMASSYPARVSRHGVTVWITGIPGAGKSTIARLTAAELRARGRRVEVLDGDEIRRELSRELGFSREDRDTNVARIGYVADLLSRNGVTVLAAVVSPYRAARDAVRARHGERFVEVHADAPVQVCAERDPKGLYSRARRGEIQGLTGLNDPYEAPLAPELVLRTAEEAPEESVARLVGLIEAR